MSSPDEGAPSPLKHVDAANGITEVASPDGATPIEPDLPADVSTEGQTPPASGNVIPFPRTRRNPTVPSEPARAPPDQTRDERTTPLTFATLEDAVREAVSENTGFVERRHMPADELIAAVFAALSNQKIESTLADLRARLAAPPDAAPAGPSISPDDGAPPDASSPKTAFRDVVTQFVTLLTNLAPRLPQGVPYSDLQELAHQAPALLGQFLGTLANSLGPSQGAENSADPEAHIERDPPKFDLAGWLGLFGKRPPPR